MHDAHEFLKALTVVLGVAAITTVLFHWLRQPVVLGYLLAGLIIGPHVPVPLVADVDMVRTLSEIGVILLMFSVGLEFRLRRLADVFSSAGLTAIIETSFMAWLGFVAARLFGWTTNEALFTGAIIAIGSTTIVVKAFAEHPVPDRLRELVVGILVAEDLIAIILMAALTAVASGHGLSPSELAATLGRLGAFLAGLLIIGVLIVPRVMHTIVKLKRPETTVVASVGICFAIALLAAWFSYPVALGAFVAGSLVAESGDAKEIEHRIEPVRDVFAAIFFVSVGMLIDPELMAKHWLPIAVLTSVVIFGKIAAVSAGAFLTGSSTRNALQAGMSLAQIGEFSFIIATLGLSLGATRDFLYPIAVAVSAVTTLTTPYFIRGSGPIAEAIDLRLPRSIQTVASLYGTWILRIRTAPPRDDRYTGSRRLVRLLALDVIVLVGVLIAASIERKPIVRWIRDTTGIDYAYSVVLFMSAVGLLTLPFLLGIVRLAASLGAELADAAMPRREGQLDLADAPRRVLVVTLQLAIILIVGAPLVAVTQPFLPGAPVAAFIFASMAFLAVSFWKRAANLQGHVRAGAQVIAEALAKQAKAGVKTDETTLIPLQPLLPGLGEPVPFKLEANYAAVGRTLADVGLRGRTGATVLTISRGNESILVPAATETLQAGDVLALAGTAEAVNAAKTLLQVGDPTEI